MITTTEKENLKKTLGANYTAKILAVLKERNIKNSQGKDYSAGSVRNILNGQQENVQVENVIYEIHYEILENRAALAAKKKPLEEYKK
ncbi:MAG: hypothetical protein WBG71_04320 [Leeuwenhoekiella sp.]